MKKKNILWTGYGDMGTTTLYDCKQNRISKSAILIEALGSVDELNAYLGIIKVYKEVDQIIIKKGKKLFLYNQIIENIQQTLFIIQAELGGSSMSVGEKDLKLIEDIIGQISEILPPITSFSVSGGSIISASLDYARTLSRKSERRIISVYEERQRKISPVTISYLNRLSSLLFAMSRYANYYFKIKEEHPVYNNKK